MAKKVKDFESDYSLRSVVWCDEEARYIGIRLVDKLLKQKQRNFNMLDDKAKKAALEKDPQHNHRIFYSEPINFGSARTSIERKFIELADMKGYKIGRTVMDSVIVSAITRLGQEWTVGFRKNNPTMDMPDFLVENGEKQVCFYVAEKKTQVLSHVDLSIEGILAMEDEGIQFTPPPTDHGGKGKNDEIKQPKSFHESVTKAHALSPEAQAAMDALEASRKADEMARLQEQIAALKEALEARKAADAPDLTPTVESPTTVQ